MRKVMMILLSLLLLSGIAAAEEAGMNTDIKAIPDHYYTDSSKPGRVERLNYTSGLYEKSAYVYLPYGYDASTDQQYNVFYVLHGGGGSQEEYFAGEGRTSTFQRILDHMIEDGTLEPLIVVAPSYYPPDNRDSSVSFAADVTAVFHMEVSRDLIPAVDGAYRTVPSREHRAFGGFSMGSVTAWDVFMHCLDSIKYFMPISGDCWGVSQMGGQNHPDETAALLAQAVQESGYRPENYYVYAITGSNDIAYPCLTPQMASMRNYPEIFRFGENTFYGVLGGGYHNYPEVRQYIYNVLPLFFKD